MLLFALVSTARPRGFVPQPGRRLAVASRVCHCPVLLSRSTLHQITPQTPKLCMWARFLLPCGGSEGVAGKFEATDLITESSAVQK